MDHLEYLRNQLKETNDLISHYKKLEKNHNNYMRDASEEMSEEDKATLALVKAQSQRAINKAKNGGDYNEALNAMKEILAKIKK